MTCRREELSVQLWNTRLPPPTQQDLITQSIINKQQQATGRKGNKETETRPQHNLHTKSIINNNRKGNTEKSLGDKTRRDTRGGNEQGETIRTEQKERRQKDV